ncbi:hypothetical protein TNCV_106311 [Trichonephila clavipes]|nr:hypothetical protein TNCV_106311 [Trichonephila clavipes]
MDSLGHSSFPPTALGRQDDEEETPGVILLQSKAIGIVLLKETQSKELYFGRTDTYVRDTQRIGRVRRIYTPVALKKLKYKNIPEENL